MSVMDPIAVEIDESLVVRCGCGCGTPTNIRQLRAAALRADGMTVQEVADELDTSQGGASELLRQARVSSFPRWIRGHSRREFDPSRDGPTKAMVAASAHQHRWRTEGEIRFIGGKPFRIDVCAGGCNESRACRQSGPGSVPAPPLRRQSGRKPAVRRGRQRGDSSTRGALILQLLARSGSQWRSIAWITDSLQMNPHTARDQLAWLASTGRLEASRQSGRLFYRPKNVT